MMWGGARPAGMHSAVGLAATALILLLMLHQKAYGLPFVQKHFIAGTCDDPYWIQVTEAALATIDFDTAGCNDSSEDAKAFVDNILAGMPPPGTGRVLLIACYSGGTTQGDEHFARAARAGIDVFFIENSINVTEFNLSFEDHMVLQFLPDNEEGARFTGQELCRVAGRSVQRIALLYGANPDLDIRVDIALEEARANCPDSQMQVAFIKRGDWTVESGKNIFEAIFLVDSTITTVLAGNDGMAIGVIAAADKMLEPEKAYRLHVSGFDNSAPIKPYIASKRVFSTVDQLTLTANNGIWSTVQKVLHLVESNNLTSTAEVQEKLGLPDMILRTSIGPVSADPEGFLIDSVDATYRSTVRATPDTGGVTRVQVGLHDVRVENIDTADGTFSATFWVFASWNDQRLAWASNLYNGTIQRSPGSLWEPYVYVSNQQSSTINSLIYTTPSTVESDGTVRKAFKVTATLGCSMNVAPFPYDSHVCSIDIAIGSESSLVLLIPSPLGMDLRDMPEAYEGEALEPIANVNTDTPLGLRQSSVSFPMLIVHDPSYVKITFILMAWALNLVSFGQFWISPMLGNMDRAGLAITTILASTVLQADARKSKITTWLDIFFSISIAFQFITFFMSVITAHYVFDPDYESEDLVVEQMMESQRERVRNNNSSRSIKGSQSETYEYDKEGHKMLDAYLVFTDSVLGDEKDILPDRWGRRYVFPAFLVITMVLPFLPNSGNMDISRHPASGRNSSLFVINCVFLTVWLVIVGSRLVINVAISHFNYKSGVRSVKDKYKGVDPHVMEQAAQAG